MKKVSLFFAALFVIGMTLVSCGSGASTESTTDSTSVEQAQPEEAAPAADTTAAAADTTAAQQAE